MNWDEMNAAFREARQKLSMFDSFASSLGEMLIGRLRRCSTATCRALKRELRHFNMVTGEWDAA